MADLTPRTSAYILSEYEVRPLHISLTAAVLRKHCSLGLQIFRNLGTVAGTKIPQGSRSRKGGRKMHGPK
jgi:hypothetical protein